MGSTDEEESECVILINEDDAENTSESSVLLIEDSEGSPSEEKSTDEVVDEEREVIVTFCKRAKVMPHARYDCPTHPFERAECEVSCALAGNARTCGQCYCYICDKLAAECPDWTAPSLCHCNAHNKSKYWKSQWDFALTGGLATFNLELSEIDADVRYGGTILQKFTHDVSVEYNKYLSGERVPSDFHPCFCYRNLGPGQCQACGLHLLNVVYRYTSVFDLVTAFLNRAEQETPKTEAIVLLGAAKEIALHKDPALYSRDFDPSSSPNQAISCLMARITRRLQRLLVLNDFPKALQSKLLLFYQAIPFPTHCYAFSKSLSFLPWDHGLLTSVLKGQNVTGQRTQKGKKECLCEIVPVIEARIERLENGQQYKELIRYLKVVKCSDAQWMQKQRDKIPFYKCKTGDFMGAAQALLSFHAKSQCTASRLTPLQFETYLKMFRTGYVPQGRNLEDSAQWTFVGDPLKLPYLLKLTFTVFYSSPLLYSSAECWSSVVMIFGSHPVLREDGHLTALTLEEPPWEFQQLVLNESCFIVEELENKISARVSFPADVFGAHLQLEASLLFVVEAIRQMFLKESRYLNSFLEIILAFRHNFWALKLLFQSLSYHQKALHTIASLTLSDLNDRKVEMLEQWQHLGPEYVEKLLHLFLTSTDANIPSIGLSIMNVITENIHLCPWAKQVGQFLQKWIQPFGWAAYDVSNFIAISQALP
ncbi:uncharacterized protein LOC128336788 isoform X2 [Hemicordylus capensis]|uniref:uncharacterized protein LOC128336788 isoform X2 n=1 Tax=Hemicordylus capensis TaxID=884348 RepID=UPI0023032FBE|nr:uncharacterized protein LOC128336788 isoform X2 [Hemicordylus capensis]